MIGVNISIRNMNQSVLGLYFEEFEVGSEIKHALSKTIFESDNNFFSLMTMNHHPVHTNVDYASHNQHGPSVAGTVANGDSVITVAGDLIGQTGAPANGLKLYYSANNASTVITGVTYGGSLPAGTWNEMTSNPITLSSQTSGRYCCVCLVNGSKVVAAGEATEVVKA